VTAGHFDVHASSSTIHVIDHPDGRGHPGRPCRHGWSSSSTTITSPSTAITQAGHRPSGLSPEDVRVVHSDVRVSLGCPSVSRMSEWSVSGPPGLRRSSESSEVTVVRVVHDPHAGMMAVDDDFK
jgi:hypothetical protein